MGQSSTDVVDFWREAGPSLWFKGGEAFDQRCRERLGELHMVAARRELEHWNSDAEGALALQILLDQIPRNIFRGSGHGFATDPLARHYARQALAAGLDQQVEPALRMFMYMTFEHAEDMADQNLAVEKITALGNARFARYAELHREVIERFGRFPHRNFMLGRRTTPAEQAYLDAGGGF
ncbi:MAG: DUF924 family protein [Pseudoxanthomonas suwonensis]|nr:DUF924 family protein [Pseudoxanthomonas suwonensis]